MYQARDVMTTSVITVRPEATVEEVMRTLVENEVSGAPVVDDTGRLLGIISEYELLEVTHDLALKDSHVCEFMTREIIKVTPDTLLREIADLLSTYRIRRIPVVECERLVGVVSRRDILRYILEAGLTLQEFVDQLWGSEVPVAMNDALATFSSLQPAAAT